MSELSKLKDNELARIIEFCRYRENEGLAESPFRNWQIASMFLELKIARELIHKWGVTDKADAMFEDAEHPLLLNVDEVD